jgi:2-polyprenyl-6-methoxyphenol hydroxylase-like FAD-dependent oxidoreductase
MIQAGRPTQEAWLHLNDGPPIKVDLSTIASYYNFILILEQSETERILEEYLKSFSVAVERETEFISTEERASSVLSKIKLPSGETQEITSDFVIGCDGAHSSVRHLLKTPFEGGAYTGDFILGDVKLDWQWPYDSVQTFVSKRGVIASFPMRGERRYRLILIPREEVSNDLKREITLEEFQSILTELSNNQIKVLNATWLTRFSVHHRIVQSFQKGRIFLAGDAAHIHSPAGGQGMNTGIQDALNLGFKLQRVLSGKSPLSELQKYEKERLPVARGVLRGTDFVFKMALLPENPAVGLIRRSILPKLVKTKWIQRRVVSAISEMSIAKKEIERYIEKAK